MWVQKFAGSGNIGNMQSLPETGKKRQHESVWE